LRSILRTAAAFAVIAAYGAPPVLARNAPDSFADLAEKLSPAVVNISTTQYGERKKTGESTGPDEVPWDKFFEEYFKNKKDSDEPESKAPKRRQTSLGSGFIIDKTGYVVTNNHVIEDADQISVILDDDTVLEAKLIGRDEKIDVALLKVETEKDLPAVNWGNSDQSRVGDWVVAIGNPFGLAGTVTAGIISARARNINPSAGNSSFDDFIQTDAAINRGNSGGPLFNMDGQVIGINTAIFSPTGGSVGVGFAASANLVRPVLDDLRKYGRTRRGWIGVQIQSVNDEIAHSLGLDKARGALVSEVAGNGPAVSSGIESSDVILTFDGKPITKMSELPRVVAETPIDKSVDVVIWRRGQQKSVKLKVGELRDGNEKAVASLGQTPPAKDMLQKTQLKDLGLTVVEISDATREKYTLPDSVRGLVVVEIDETSDAALKGLRPGDVIDEIQLTHVGNVAEADVVIRLAKEASRPTVLLRVMSGGGIRYVPVKMVS
jgi:serine protease Do